ncbi:MAG: helix-turn-helix domain-containing protein, partial [Spirochaetales bacterium]|nr:helix-turn-helix domain-containing protein [Spirochaetales bacterium]
MATALITPAIIEWARDRRELTDTRLATSVHVSAEKIRQWTAGQEKPTIRQAQLLARALKIPFGYLYLDNPPKEDPLIPDLRTIATRRERSLSPDFLDLVRSLQRKQDWYRDFLVSEGAAPLPFVESYSPNDDPQKVAESMRTIWGLDVHSGAKVGSWSAHIKFLCDLAESHGILILRSGV